MLFSSICWQCNFITVTSYFLRWAVSHALFISVVILSCWILYICVWAPDFCTSTQGLHFFIASLSGLVSSPFSHGSSLCHHNTNTEFALSFFIFEFFISQNSSIAFGRGESEWMTCGLDYAMDSPIFALSFLWCSTCFTLAVCYTSHVSSFSKHVSVWRLATLRILAAFPSADIYVRFPSQWYPSHRYVLHSDTWGPLFTIS